MAFVQVAGVLVFVLTWVLILRDRWPMLPLGRAASTLLGACLMVAFGVLSPDSALQAVNLQVIALLFGCMLIGAHMERQGVYTWLTSSLSRADSSPTALLVRVSFASAAASALLTNDTVCIILPPMVLRICITRALPLNPVPYMLAIATAANIGSACSPIGNPQNMIIALLGKVSFWDFRAVLLPSILGVALNTVLIAWVYKADLNGTRPYIVTVSQRVAVGHVEASARAEDQRQHVPTAPHEEDVGQAGWDVGIGQAAPAAFMDSRNSRASMPATLLETDWNKGDTGVLAPARRMHEPNDSVSEPTAWPVRTKLIRGLLANLPLLLFVADRWIGLGWMACLISVTLCVLDGTPPENLLAKVDGILLLFFACLFIVVHGFNKTGLPDAAWAFTQGTVDVTSSAGLAALSILVTVGSNTVSNVPLVLLLAPKVPTLGPDPSVAWLLLAWISTVAGNLTLLGSVANLIVAERCKDVAPLAFGEYARIGVPSTLCMLALGVPVVAALARAQG